MRIGITSSFTNCPLGWRSPKGQESYLEATPTYFSGTVTTSIDERADQFDGIKQSRLAVTAGAEIGAGLHAGRIHDRGLSARGQTDASKWINRNDSRDGPAKEANPQVTMMNDESGRIFPRPDSQSRHRRRQNQALIPPNDLPNHGSHPTKRGNRSRKRTEHKRKRTERARKPACHATRAGGRWLCARFTWPNTGMIRSKARLAAYVAQPPSAGIRTGTSTAGGGGATP